MLFLLKKLSVPGDIRIVSSKDLFISQSVLTGESNPVEKYSNLLVKKGAISDLSNIVLMGTNVLSGAATGIVLGTGKHIFLNTISESLKSTKVETNFEKGIDDDNVLYLAYLNSYFQIRLKNLMDRAILEFEEEHYSIKNEYKKLMSCHLILNVEECLLL